MKLATLALLAVGGLAIAVPAAAEDAYVGARVGPVGVGVDVDAPRHRDRVYHEERVTTDGYARGERCRTVIIHEEGMTKKIKRCRD
jgi:hypothetical protein